MMSNQVLIIGEPGTGKSTSFRNLDPESTFIINVLGKPLPFRGYKKNYTPLASWEDTEGNFYTSDNYAAILKCIEIVNRNERFKTLIIDDWQYILANEFMRRATEKGFEKFSEIGQHAWRVISLLSTCRESLIPFVISHSDTDEYGKVKCKTIGKLLNEKVSIEGMFTTVLHSLVTEEGYKFLTQNDSRHVAKSPVGMFEQEYIDNDLQLVINAIKQFED